MGTQTQTCPCGSSAHTYCNRAMTYSEFLMADQERKESVKHLPHKPMAESQNWFTKVPGGRWYDACRDCTRLVVMVNGKWRHAS